MRLQGTTTLHGRLEYILVLESNIVMYKTSTKELLQSPSSPKIKHP